MNIRECRTYLLGLSKDNRYFLCGALNASKATSPEEQAANLFSAGSWPWDGRAHLQCWCCSLNLFWEMSPRTHRLAPRTYSGLPLFPCVRKKTSSHKPRHFFINSKWVKKKKSKSFFHAFKATLDRLANRLLMYALGLGNFLNRLAKNDMCVNSAALDLRQRIESVPQTKKGFHPFKELLRGRLMQASGILNPVIAVQRILRLVPGEPPLVGHLIAGIGLEYLGHLVRNFDKLILRVPIINIFQIDSSHRKILHFSLFGVGRKRNGVTAENGTAPRDTLSRSLERKMRLSDTRPHKRTKIYYRLCTV